MSKKTTVSNSHNFISHNIKLEEHEISTINFFLKRNEMVEIIIASHTPKSTSPDLFMRSIVWEMKSPTVGNDQSISRLFYRAVGQSHNVIFDLRRLKTDKSAHKQLMKLTNSSRRLHQILIIRKNSTLEEYRKK